MNKSLEQYLREDFGSVLRLLEGSDVTELDLREGEIRLLLKRHIRPEGLEEGVDAATRLSNEEDVAIDAAVATNGSRSAVTSGTAHIVSPSVGTFYRSEQPGAPAMVSEGDFVEAGTVVGVVEALQVLTEVEAGCSGVVQRMLAAEGEPVEYGQPLVEVRLGE